MQSVFIFKLHFSYLLNRWLRGALCAYVMEGWGGGSTFLAIVISSNRYSSISHVYSLVLNITVTSTVYSR